jgi:hypothetical protein
MHGNEATCKIIPYLIGSHTHIIGSHTHTLHPHKEDLTQIIHHHNYGLIPHLTPPHGDHTAPYSTLSTTMEKPPAGRYVMLHQDVFLSSQLRTCSLSARYQMELINSYINKTLQSFVNYNDIVFDQHRSNCKSIMLKRPILVL